MAHRPLLIGAASRPHPREAVNGDRIHLEQQGTIHRIAVIDGLGHGPDAAAAAARAVDTLAAIPDADVLSSIRACHEALKGTRGAALSVIRIDLDAGRMTFAGIGNVEGVLVSPGRKYLLMPQRGIAGAVAPRIRVEEANLPDSFMIMMCTDGIRSGARSDLRFGPIISAEALANELLMAWGRDADDAAVVVASRQPT
jgi:negative regulator of sigma-B (phosphoserine phosphatase)